MIHVLLIVSNKLKVIKINLVFLLLTIKTGTFGQPEAKVHLGRAWRIERPELALLTAPNFREYFYSKIRFSTPALSALLPLAGKISLS